MGAYWVHLYVFTDLRVGPVRYLVRPEPGREACMNPFDVSGRHILVTGASSGLGRHFATLLATRGARVSMCARRLDRLDELCTQLAAAGHVARPFAMDVADASSVETALDAACAASGGLDVVVNNAGVALAKPALEVSETDWDRLMDTNLKGAWLVAQGSARRMRGSGGGSIINIASITGLRTAGRLSTYATSKAALIHLTRSLALELARHDIRVNAIAPGYIQTDINRDFLDSEAGLELRNRIPQRRFGQPEDLDGVLLLLASSASAYMTGSVLTVDGGHTQSGL